MSPGSINPAKCLSASAWYENSCSKCGKKLRHGLIEKPLSCSRSSFSALLRCTCVIIGRGELLSWYFLCTANDLWPIQTNEAPHFLEMVNAWEGRRKFKRGLTPAVLWAFEWMNKEEPRFLWSHFTMETVAQIFQSLTKTQRLCGCVKEKWGGFCFLLWLIKRTRRSVFVKSDPEHFSCKAVWNVLSYCAYAFSSTCLSSCETTIFVFNCKLRERDNQKSKYCAGLVMLWSGSLQTTNDL